MQWAAPDAADVLMNATAAKPAARVGLFTLHGRKFPRDFKAEIALAILAVSGAASCAQHGSQTAACQRMQQWVFGIKCRSKAR